jgi:hypothetical protein
VQEIIINQRKPEPLPPLPTIKPEPDDDALYNTKIEAPVVPKILITGRKILQEGGKSPTGKMLSENQALSIIASDYRIIFYGEVKFDPVGVEMLTKLCE